MNGFYAIIFFIIITILGVVLLRVAKSKYTVGISKYADIMRFSLRVHGLIFVIVGIVGFGGALAWVTAQLLREVRISKVTPIIQQTPSLSPSLQIVDTPTWQTYRNEEFGFEVKYPKNWKEGEFILRGSGFNQEFQDIIGKYSSSLGKIGNYNQATGKPYESLYDYINMPYKIKTIKVDGHEAIQPLPRSGSEHINSTIFFSKDFKSIYTLTLTTNNITEATIEEGQKLFDQILSTFRFVE